MRVVGLLVSATCSLLCACAASAPARPASLVHQPVGVATVDIAPVNMNVAIEPGAENETGAVRSRAEATLANTAIDALDHRHYAVGTLLHRGGPASTADATLYILGSSFVPVPRMPRANIIAEHVAQDVVHDAMLASVVTSSAFACPDGTDCTVAVAETSYEQQVQAQCGEDAQCVRALLAITSDDDVRLPAPTNDNDAVGTGGSPSLYVAMTLIDNKTGAVLWHSHATTQANAAHDKDVAKAARSLVASLPTRNP
ncbi:MAG TPA: hypothetical protein VGM90_08595 [Kofleriaceae bacterium]|jgi:hypothetical protein